MKKKLILFALLFPILAFAADSLPPVDPVVLPPEWILQIIHYLQTLPYIGPAMVWLLKMVAIITPIMSMLVVVVQTVLTIPEVVARFSGAHELADQLKFYGDKVMYWLKYFSVFNAQKKP